MNWIARMCMLLVPVLLVAAADPLDRKWDLESLQPGDPGAYFERAEEVADAASSDPERALAVRLYALAATLDEARWSRSSLLGIIALLEDESRVRGLRALLEFYEEEQPQLLPSTRLVMGAGDRVTVSAVDVLSLYRSGMAVGAGQRECPPNPKRSFWVLGFQGGPCRLGPAGGADHDLRPQRAPTVGAGWGRRS